MLIGDTTTQGGVKGTKMPPMKNETERYDSISNEQGCFKIYDNAKSYPGYLITY